jgi:hypothetical protein
VDSAHRYSRTDRTLAAVRAMTEKLLRPVSRTAHFP